MRVFLDNEQHQHLLAAYETATSTITDARGALAPSVARAFDLLERNDIRNSPLHLLNELRGDLRRDAADLRRRGEFMVEADARLALQLSAQHGDLLNRHLADDALASGWTYDEAAMRHELASLRQLSNAEQIRRASDIRRLTEALRILDAPHTTTGTYGDLDATSPTCESATHYASAAAHPNNAAETSSSEHFDDTANQDTILKDEFQAIIHDNGNLTLVLPGVVDLSTKLKDPSFGYEEGTNTLRDVDQEALPSSHSTLLADNGYGRRVRDWIEAQVRSGAIQPGARTVIVGHSFGGDTALDLAADPDIATTLDVTHVVSAGYHNEPQFDDLPASTQVLAIQNIYDLAVAGEAIGEVVNDVRHLQVPSTESAQMAQRIATEGAELWTAPTKWFVDSTVDEIEDAVDDVLGIDVEIPNLPDFELEHDTHEWVTGQILLTEFEGGLSDIGHHQDHYSEYIRSSQHPGLTDFVRQLDEAGFTADGTTISIDVTKPDR